MQPISLEPPSDKHKVVIKKPAAHFFLYIISFPFKIKNWNHKANPRAEHSIVIFKLHPIKPKEKINTNSLKETKSQNSYLTIVFNRDVMKKQGCFYCTVNFLKYIVVYGATRSDTKQQLATSFLQTPYQIHNILEKLHEWF